MLVHNCQTISRLFSPIADLSYSDPTNLGFKQVRGFGTRKPAHASQKPAAPASAAPAKRRSSLRRKRRSWRMGGASPAFWPRSAKWREQATRVRRFGGLEVTAGVSTPQELGVQSSNPKAEQIGGKTSATPKLVVASWSPISVRRISRCGMHLKTPLRQLLLPTSGSPNVSRPGPAQLPAFADQMKGMQKPVGWLAKG